MDFNYDLPEQCIAKHPPARREDARLLHVMADGQRVDCSIGDLPALLPGGSGLWVNETKVLHARMMAVKPTGGVLELLLLEPRDMPVERALTSGSPVAWNCLVGGAKKWKVGSLEVPESGVGLTVERHADDALSFSWEGDEDFGAVLDRLGRIPLPPYMRREAEAQDAERYQTVFARLPGSVAAPTAGLHLTEDLLARLEGRGVHCDRVVLHVGVGTFKPIEGRLDDHRMHGERCLVSREALNRLGRTEDLTAVGTTTLRTIESLYWLACRWHSVGTGPSVDVGQWIHRDTPEPFASFPEAMQWLAQMWTEDAPLAFVTHLMIVPGYRIRSAKRLLTNFHMPNSTLLCIVEAMVGPDWRRHYQHAVTAGYRFLSYGDACLLERRN